MKASKQSGFVLVVGMLLLTVASGAVISGMSVNKYQERQAGNYVRTNNYEAGADEAFRRFEREGWGEEIKTVVKGRLGGSEKGAVIFPHNGDDNWLPSEERENRAREREEEKKDEENESGDDENIKYAFTQAGVKEVVKLEGGRVKVVFWGREALGDNSGIGYGNGRDILSAIYSIKAGGAYQDALVGCEGVNAAGGGIIDSYDSRDGAYDKNDNGKKSNATIKSSSQEGDVVLSSGQPVYGDVESAGRIVVGNSGTIHGDLKADGDIVVRNGGADIQGDVSSSGSVEMVNGGSVSGNIRANGDVTINGGGANVGGNVASRQAVRLTSSGRIQGNVEANTEIVTGNWSSRIDGNATAPVVRTTSNRDVAEQVGGAIKPASPDVAEVPEVVTEPTEGEDGQQSCEAFTSTTDNGATIGDLIDALASYASSGSLSLGGGNQTYELTPDGLSNNNTVSDPKKDVTVDGIFPEPTNVLVLDNFSLGGSANFVVDGGDMTLYVKGNIDIGGGATFSVAEGSSLKIVTEGRFNLGSNLNVASESPTDDDGNPILSLYSANDDEGASGWNAGVNITANSAFKGTIFAPYSTVNVAGSGALYGAVKGRRVEVNGGAGIHYDESLMESTIGTDGADGNWELQGLSYGAGDD
ncbi:MULTISPECIES: polymer-forming cytoskeletal protein [Chromohalobacter]|uniref:Polymer-forming cytoskeletal protein n=1 Tax=Chromohalobacter moromii TaxID=2860329 RepID=A0A9X3AYR8_9GAMM|nr:MULTISPECIES: polymer-forming cytoskeletal protein [Chromohalobacter]MCK2047268.1 polymer-forming cytoskeletal protein [Chromohalobacter moromii]MCT8470085.1 polymer-forming cytoskeletal protein [Chromohalobacter canadensis]MCT8473140.1 polymer-forming cytoskeletal protein [Chromohalobacter canadensis]MCT8500526.1 polymer-forming cytoskeletal protein [Chromohalobacter canadensis]MCT8506846.1 polymer-forming cytoskeletal protein [Chromohalobacter moromii]